MASPEAIRKALTAIFTQLDRSAIAKTRSDAAALEKSLGRTQAGDIPTSDVIATTPAPGKSIPSRGETGSGPDPLAESLGTKFDIPDPHTRPIPP